MVVRLLIWSLVESQTTIGELENALPALEPPSTWIWNGASERFGLVAYGDKLLPAVAEIRELIGDDPDVYEFAGASGYAVEPAVLERLRDDADNFVGLKVSDTPYDRFARYLLPGLDVFVGPEAFIAEGMANGAVGAVSALASAFPAEVAEVVRDPTPDGAARLGELRAAVERFPRHAALKRLLGLRGIPVRADVRAPLRPLTSEEQDALDAWDAARTG